MCFPLHQKGEKCFENVFNDILDKESLSLSLADSYAFCHSPHPLHPNIYTSAQAGT